MEHYPIYDVLPTGRENAVSLSTIQTMLDSDNRAARKEIEKERAEGAPILSTTTPPGGYFRAANVDELNCFVASMTRRAANIHTATRAAQSALEEAIGDELKTGG